MITRYHLEEGVQGHEYERAFWNSLKVPLMTSGQLLTCVYLGGLLLPCLVTLLTIGREMGFLYAARLAVRQAGWVVFFSLLIAWVL